MIVEHFINLLCLIAYTLFVYGVTEHYYWKKYNFTIKEVSDKVTMMRLKSMPVIEYIKVDSQGFYYFFFTNGQNSKFRIFEMDLAPEEVELINDAFKQIIDNAFATPQGEIK